MHRPLGMARFARNTPCIAFMGGAWRAAGLFRAHASRRGALSLYNVPAQYITFTRETTTQTQTETAFKTTNVACQWSVPVRIVSTLERVRTST